MVGVVGVGVRFAADSGAATESLHEIAVGKQVSSLMEPEKQFEWALRLVRSGTFDSIDAFHEHCFNLTEQSFLAAGEKVLLRTWSLLRRLPRELIDEVSAKELMHLRKCRDAIELHALGVCVGSTQLKAQEAMVRAQHASGKYYAAERHAQRLTQAAKLATLDELASELLTSATPSFFVDPGDESTVLGTAKASVVRALEATRRDKPSSEADALLETLRLYEQRLARSHDSHRL